MPKPPHFGTDDELVDDVVVLGALVPGSDEGILLSRGERRPSRAPRAQAFDATTQLPGRVRELLGVPPAIRLAGFGVPKGPPQKWSRGKGPAWRYSEAGVDCIDAWDFESDEDIHGFAPAVVLKVDADAYRMNEKERVMLLPLEHQPRRIAQAPIHCLDGFPQHLFFPQRLIITSDHEKSLDDVDVEVIQFATTYQVAGIGAVGARIFDPDRSPSLSFDVCEPGHRLQVHLRNYGSEKRVRVRFEGKARADDVRLLAELRAKQKASR